MLHLDTLMTLAIAAGLGTLLAAVIEIFGAARRATAAVSTGRLPGWALLAISIVFAAVMAWLWLPLPVRLGLAPRLLGALLYFVGLALSL